MFQIEQVVTQAAEHLIDRVRIAIVERGVRGHTRTDLVDIELALRTRTDKSHIADKYIPQLGQLVQMMLT